MCGLLLAVAYTANVAAAAVAMGAMLLGLRGMLRDPAPAKCFSRRGFFLGESSK